MENKGLKEADRGIAFDIESYCIHDGPGIRTIIFLKGCPLNCRWCQNPEGKKLKSELLYMEELCIHCHSCIKACPNKALKADNGSIAIDRDRCSISQNCVEICPTGALKLAGIKYSIEDILNIVEADRRFFENTGGGVTLSGGEPAFQSGFIRELLKALKEADINTCIETCGYLDWETLEKIILNTDMVLYDIKLINEDKHIEYTGVSNKVILENLERLADTDKDFIIRIPLIPGINDSEEDIDDFIEYFKTLKRNTLRLDILPYNPLCVEKYGNLQENYRLSGLKGYSSNRLKKIVNHFKKSDFQVNIGGS